MSEARRATLAVLAKAPVPGFAKTRLAPLLGPAGAAALHAVLVERTLRTARTSGLAPVALWCAPGRAHPLFLDAAADGSIELRDQPEGDLGARMRAAFEAHLPGGPVVLLGTDCPGLRPVHLRRAAVALEDGAEASIVSALDGGYAVLGLRRVDPSLFAGVDWGGPDVLATTRERLRRLGWTVHEQGALRDVDLPEDVAWLLSSGLLDERERAQLAPYLP